MDDVAMRKMCDDNSFYAYGTSRIFQKREARLKTLRVLITFLGIAIPISLGGVAAAAGADWKALPTLITLAGALTVAQLVLSSWSVVARWDEQYAAAVDGMLAHTSLFNKWKDLASDKSAQFADSFKSLKAAWEYQEQTDMRQSISDKEMRYAAREAYFYFKKPCHVCKNIPNSRKPTDCEGCGNF